MDHGNRLPYATAASDPHAAVSERAAGRYVSRMFLDYFNAGAERSYAYELIDQGADTEKMELSFGLLRVNGTENRHSGRWLISSHCCRIRGRRRRWAGWNTP